MAEYDPDDQTDEREQAGYDQAEAAAQQQLLRGEEPQTFGFNGQPVEQPAQQAIPTAPPLAPQQAAQAAPQQQPSDRYDVVWQQQPAQQPQQPAQQPQPQPRSLTLAPYPGQGSDPRLTARERAAQNREAPYSTPVATEERYDVAPELRLQPTGGLGSVVALEFENFGHDVLSAVNAFAKNQLNMPVPQLEAVNAQFKEHIDKVRDGLDPARRAAQDVSIFDPSSFAGKDAGAVAEGYAVSLATGILGGLGPGLAAKMAVKTGARVAAGSFAAAGRAADVAAIGGAGVTGAVQQAGARYEDYATTIDHMTEEDKQKSAMYQGFRAQNMDDAAAKEAMKSRFPMLQQLGVNFVTSTGIAAVTPGLGGAMPRLATRGRNIAAGAAEAGGSAGAGTAGSAAIQEQAKVEAGTQPAINWGRVAGEGAVAAGLGAGFGGAFGAFHGTSPREAPPPPPGPRRVDNVTPPAPEPMLALPPPEPTLALPPPPIRGPGARVDTVTPGGVPPEHTAALNAAGIGGRAIQTEPGAQQFRPPIPRVDIGADEVGPHIPPRYTEPAGTIYPPERPPLGSGEAPPARAAAPPPGPLLLTASRERGPGFTMHEPAPAPLQLAASRERGPGFEVQQPGAPVRAYEQPAGPFVQPSTLPENFGIGRPRAPETPPAPPPGPAEGFARGAPVERQDYYPGAAPRPGPPRLAASRERGAGFEAPPEGAPVRAYEQPAGPPTPPPRLPPETTPRLAASRERGAGFTMQEPEPAPPQVTASRERGEGFTTEPAAPPPAPRPSEGQTPKQLIAALAAEGMPQAQINRLVARGRDKLAAALDQRAQERVGRGEESAPAPRGAEAREPAPAARPSEGMSHKALGEALEKLGLSKKEVNQFVNKVQRAAEYDRLMRREADAIERVSGERKDEKVSGEPTTIRTVMEAGPDETKGHPQGEREDRRWRALKPERTADGKYKGAPEWVQTPRHYRQLQKLMKQLVKEGEKGRFWYEDSMKKIMAVTRGNLREADRLTGLVAIYSPQRPVPTNMGLAVKAYEQWHRGEPVRVGSGSQDARAQHWLDTGQDWGGRKTNNFYLNLMHELITAHPEVLEPGNNRLNLPADVAAAIKGATVDLWVLRAMGHRVDAAGGPGGTGARGSITDKYGFSQLEIQRLAGELNAGVPVGEQRWLPHQVQAALWSAIKARFELPAVKEATWKESLAAKFATMEPDKNNVLQPTAPAKNGPARQGHMAIWRKHALAADPADVANVIDRARGDFGAALDRMSQHASVEAIPSKDLNHPINDASRAAQEQFTREAHALILDEDGNNELARRVGVNLGYDTYGAGSFEGRVRPNVVTTLVPEKPAGIFDRTKARMYARAAQFIYRQDAVPIVRLDAAHDFTGDYAAHNPTNTATRRFDTQAEAEAHAATRPGWTVSGKEIAQGIHIEFNRSFDADMQARLLAELGREIGPDAGFTKVGDREAIVVNFRGDNGLPDVNDVRVTDAIGRIAARDEFDVKQLTHFGADGEYGPVQDWKRGSAGASALAEAAGGSPAFQQWLRDRHAAFGKLLDDWADPEARLAASRPGGGTGPDGRSTLELPQARAPPDARAARERAAERRADQVEATPAANPLTDTPEFRSWFGDSQITDDAGAPLRVYHGTDAAFTEFDPSKMGVATGAPSARKAFFFSSDPDVSSSYALRESAYESGFVGFVNKLTGGLYEKGNEAFLRAIGRRGVGAVRGGENVIPTHLRMENPLEINFRGQEIREQSFSDLLDQARRGGHDGVIFRNTIDPGFRGGESPSDVYAVFNPDQIRSAVSDVAPPVPTSREQRNQPTAESPLGRVMKDERVNAPVREAIDAGGSLHDGLRAIANNPFINKRLPHVAAYARTMLRLAPDLPLRPSETVRRGAFVSEENLATGRRSEHVEVREKSAEVLLHEATHGTVGHFVDSLQPGSREFQVLTTIRDEFARGAEAHGRLGDERVAYALSNPHELHSMLRTNPEMHDLMRGIVPTAEYRTRMAQLGYPVGPAKSLWQSFVRFIRQALHLPQNVTSLMDHVMRPLDDIAEAGARFNRDLPVSTRDSMVYRRGWEQEPLVARTEHELPSFSDVKDWYRDKTDPMGRAGNLSSGVRGAIRQVMPTHQLTGFNRHLFNSSQPGVGNLADNLTRAAEGVERVSREYAEGRVGPDWLPSANGKPREQAFREQNDKIDAATGLELTHSSRLDTHPAYPREHPLNSHSRATPEQFDELQKGRVVKGSTTRSGGYNSLTTAQKQVFNDTFKMQRQLRVDEGDAALRGIGKTYLTGVTDAQVETMARQMRTMEGVNEILANTDTNPVARAFGDQWDGNKEFVRAIAAEWKRGWINNYVPLHRSGDWVVNFTDSATGEKGMISRYTMREAEQARLQLEVDGAEPSLVLSRERRTPSDIPRLTIVDRFESKLQANPALNADQVTAARDLLTKVLLDQSRFAGRNRERLGVHGADPTKLKEAMAQRFQALKNSVGHLEYGPQYEAGLNAMRRHVQEMGRGSGTVRIPDISGERAASNADAIQAQQYMEEMRRRKPVSEDANTLLTKTAHNATMLTYFKFLASPAQTLMNGIDTYVQGIPRIGAQFGIGRATTALARASAEIMPRQFARGVAGTGAAARGRLDPGEWNSAMQIRDHLIQNSRRNDAAGMNALFQRMQDGNLIGYSSYRDLQAMAKGGNGWIRQKADMAADMVSILHNKMEDANRAAVALAAYDVHFRKNGNRAAAVDYAEHILRTAMPNFGLSNKPRFATSQGGFGAWGIPVAQFRQHGMWAYSQMALDFRNAFKGADAATKTEARMALAFTIGMQTVLFGALNWLADPLRYLWGAYDWASGGRPQDHSHDFRRYAEKLFGVTGGQFVSRGALGAAGYGPYTVERMGMINAALVPKMEGDWKNPKDVTYAAMTAVAGVPALGAATEIITGLSNFAAGNYRQAAVDLLPKVLRDPVKAYTGETEGQISRRGTLLQTPEQISTLDTVYQVLGFKSARQGERSEQTGSQRQLIAEVAASRERATRDAAHALINGSASDRRAADLAVKAHNKAYPGSQIDPKDVFSYRKREVERLRDPSLTGIAVPKAMRPYVREAGAFANY